MHISKLYTYKLHVFNYICVYVCIRASNSQYDIGGLGAQAYHQHQRRQQIFLRNKRPGEEGEYKKPSSRFEKITLETWSSLQATDLVSAIIKRAASPPRSNKAMRDSVEEVCRDITWGERREIGRIGLSLQDHICRDLIEESIIEMTPPPPYHQHDIPSSNYNHHHPRHSLVLPFEACKRRLCF